MSLPPKREVFCQAVASGKAQSDAYRLAFDATKMKASTINQAASRLMKDSRVTARIQQLRLPATEATALTLEAHLRRLDDLSIKAEQEGKYAAAVAAEISRGKAAGLYVERTEISGPGGAPMGLDHFYGK